MSQNNKKKKGQIIAILGFAGVVFMGYTAISYQLEHNHRTGARSSQGQQQGQQQGQLGVVSSRDGSNPMGQQSTGQTQRSGMEAMPMGGIAPKLSTNTTLPNNIPPAMLKAMEERGMSVDELRGSGKANTDGASSGMSGGQFPEAMQKALAERNAKQAAQGEVGTAPQATAPQTTMGTQVIGQQRGGQFPPAVMQGVAHIKNSHSNNELLARLEQLLAHLSTNMNDVDKLIEASDIFMGHGNVQAAQYFLESAGVAAPSNAHVAYLLGKALAQNFETEAAAAHWERSLSLDDNPAVRHELALMYRYQLNKPEIAMEYLNMALISPRADSKLKGIIEREIKR